MFRNSVISSGTEILRSYYERFKGFTGLSNFGDSSIIGANLYRVVLVHAVVAGWIKSLSKVIYFYPMGEGCNVPLLLLLLVYVLIYIYF